VIEPVYNQDGITIFCANVFDVLPQLKDAGVSFVWADPPYGIQSVQTSGHFNGRPSANPLLTTTAPTVPVGAGKPFGKTLHGPPIKTRLGQTSGGTAGRTKVIPANVYPVVIGDDSTDTATEAFCACSAAFPKARHVWWGANHYSASLPSSSSWIVWDKENTACFADAELAWSNHGGAVRICQHRWNGLLKGSERTEKRFHPNQKPVYLATWCFERFGKPGDVILEPFMGSGSGLRAAKRMNRRAIGIELSEQYCQEVIKRLAQGTLGLDDEEDEAA